jgi:hypothetical protein
LLAISLAISPSYGMGIEAVPEAVGVRLDVLLAVRKQREQSMAWVVGVFNDFPGLPLTPPHLEVLDGRELGPSDVLGCPHHPLLCHVIEGGAIAIPSRITPPPCFTMGTTHAEIVRSPTLHLTKTRRVEPNVEPACGTK